MASVENLDGAVLFLGKPVHYWAELDKLVERQNLNEGIIADYFRVRGELAYLKETIKKLSGEIHG